MVPIVVPGPWWLVEELVEGISDAANPPKETIVTVPGETGMEVTLAEVVIVRKPETPDEAEEEEELNVGGKDNEEGVEAITGAGGVGDKGALAPVIWKKSK